MRRMIQTEVAGKSCYLFYSNNARFELNDKYGNTDGGGVEFDQILGTETREKVKTTVDIFNILAGYGNAARTFYGMEPGGVITDEDMEFMTDAELVEVMMAIYSAITVGLNREVPNLEDTDLILIELEKKRSIQTKGQG